MERAVGGGREAWMIADPPGAVLATGEPEGGIEGLGRCSERALEPCPARSGDEGYGADAVSRGVIRCCALQVAPPSREA